MSLVVKTEKCIFSFFDHYFNFHLYHMQMTNSLTGSSTLPTKVPALGRLWASVPNTRLLLNRETTHRIRSCGKLSDGDQPVRRSATLIKSCRQVW